MRLLAVEFRRALSRRLTRVLVLLFVALTAVGSVIAVFSIDEHSESFLAWQQEQAVTYCAADRAAAREGRFRIDGAVPTEADVEECRDLLAAKLEGDPEGEEFFWYEDPRPQFVELWVSHRNEESALITVITLLMLVGLGAAASMVGAEWKHGTIATQLVWEPRRVPVFVSKLVAASISAGVIAILLQIAFCVIVLPVFLVRGTTTGVDAEWMLALAGGILRGGMLVAIAAALGASLAMLLRNTAGAVLTVFLWSAVAERFLVSYRPRWQPWMIGENLATVLTGRRLSELQQGRDPLEAALVLLGYVALVAVAAAASFRRRDIAGAT